MIPDISTQDLHEMRAILRQYNSEVRSFLSNLHDLMDVANHSDDDARLMTVVVKILHKLEAFEKLDGNQIMANCGLVPRPAEWRPGTSVRPVPEREVSGMNTLRSDAKQPLKRTLGFRVQPKRQARTYIDSPGGKPKMKMTLPGDPANETSQPNKPLRRDSVFPDLFNDDDDGEPPF